MPEDLKNKILQVLDKVYTTPGDLSIGEIAKAAGVSDITASKYVSVLEAEGKIEISRKVGKAVFYRIKRGKQDDQACALYFKSSNSSSSFNSFMTS